MKNRKNNKGFSLVELIVVVAIMAVLVGVLAPAYLSYVEKSRAQKDASAVAEVIEAVKVACADENVAKEITGNVTVTVADNALPTAGATGFTNLNKEIQTVISNNVDFTSKAYDGKSYSIAITVDATTGTIKIADYATSNWSS